MVISSRSRLFIAFLSAFILAGCYAPARKASPQVSQVQIREVQTKDFDGERALDGMKAVLAALQDEGYSIETSNTDLGLITASRVIHDIDTKSRNSQAFWYGIAKDYRAARSWTVTANVAEIGDKLRIRISLVEQELSETGGVMYSQQVTDKEPYQALFSKIDKSVFLQRNKL